MIDYKKKSEDEFIRAVAEDCINNMSDEDKEYIRKNPVSGEYHFGYALYIANIVEDDELGKIMIIGL